ncbi:hypothetical protein pb186bvf_007128 [Paramecium bursaria]
MNCEIHPFKQCSIYTKNKLVCPLCLIPVDQQQQIIENSSKPITNKSIIDIDLIEQLANSLLIEPQIQPSQEILNQLEGYVMDQLKQFVDEAYLIIEQATNKLQGMIFQQIYNVRMKIESQTQTEDIKQLSESLNLLRSKDPSKCIDSLNKLHHTLITSKQQREEFLNTDKLNQFSQQMKFLISEFKKKYILLLGEISFEDVDDQVKKVFEGRQQNRKNSKFKDFTSYTNKSFNKSALPENNRLSVEQIKSIEQQVSVNAQNQISSAIISGSILIAGTISGNIEIFDVEQLESLSNIQAHKDAIRLMSKNNNETHICTYSQDKNVKVWKKSFLEDEAQFTITQEQEFSHQLAQVLCMVIADNVNHQKLGKVNMLITGGADHSVRMWNYLNGQYLFSYSGHSSDVYGIAFNPKNQYIASGSQDKTVRLWDAASFRIQKQVHRFIGHTDSIMQVVQVHEDNWILSCSLDKTFKIWDVRSKELYKSFNSQYQFYTMLFFQQGQVVLQGLDLKVRIYDYRIGTILHEIGNNKRKIDALAISSERYIVIAEGNTLNSFY